MKKDQIIENLIAAAKPGGIEAQEKAGQIEQSFAATLPKEMRPDRSAFEKLGFVFGKEDDLFVEAVFPDGWRKRPTEHSMWTHVLDEKEQKRAAIFYKAAFYDRRAHVRLSPRFYLSTDYNDKEISVFVVDERQEIGKRITINQSEISGSSDRVYNAEASLKKWLEEHYPDYGNPLAYWD